MYTSTELLNMRRDHLVEVCMTLQGEVHLHRTESGRLRSLVDEKALDERRMFEKAERLQNNVVQLQRELTEARESKKVVLPREVAEAIEYLGENYSRRNIMAVILGGQLKGVNLDYSDKRNEALYHIRNYEFNDIFDALANGYTVEEPPTTEDKIRAGAHRLIEEWETKPCHDDPEKDLVEKIVVMVREVLAEDRQEEE